MWGATFLQLRVKKHLRISTHTPHVGCDYLLCIGFLPLFISTHTPHVGCDKQILPLTVVIMDFNSHTPCGVRRYDLLEDYSLIEFQLTHPMWGATEEKIVEVPVPNISTHTPHVGCDCNPDT